MWQQMNKVSPGAACVAVLCLLAPTGASAQWGSERSGALVRAAFGECGDPCRITRSPGGDAVLFAAAARSLRQDRSDRRFVIDGPCDSACVLFADLARRNVCITDNARFGFHRGTILYVRRTLLHSEASVIGHFRPPHSKDLNAWVLKRGGYPVRSLLYMNAQEARRFWRPC